MDNLKNLHRITDAANLPLAEFKDRERNAEDRAGTFVKEHVPDAKGALDGEGADEQGHEPGGRAETDSWQLCGQRAPSRCASDSVGGGIRLRIAAAAEFGPDGGHVAFLEGGHENPEVDVCAFEADGVSAGEVVGGDEVEHPEGFGFGQEEQEEAGEEVEGLAVADLGLM